MPEPPQSLPDAPPPGLLRRAAPRLALSLAIAGAFIWLLRRGGLPFAPPEEAIHHLRWWGIPACALLVIAASVLRTSRWIYLLRPMAPNLKPLRVFGLGLVGFAAVFFAPLRMGEIVRPYLVTREGEVTFVQAVGTVAAERIVDGLVLVLMTAAALAMSTPLSPPATRVGSLPIPVALVPHTILLATLMFSLAFAAMAIFYFARSAARRLVSAVFGVISPRLARFAADTVDRLAESFGFLPSWERAAPFVRTTLIYWLVNGCAHYVVLRAVGLPTTLAQGFVTMGVIGLGSLLPAGPGFFGAYQVATYTGLAMYYGEGDVLTKGAVAVFVMYVTQLGVNALQGVAGWAILARTPKSPSTAAT